jgi:zinc transport system permease protein
MIDLLKNFAAYLHYPFVLYALGTGTMIALCSALLGVPLVLKRFSFIGDGLAHVAFGAMAVASVLGMTQDIWIVLPVTVLSAILLLYGNRHSMIQGDAAIAVISVGALSIGYLLMSLFTRSPNLSGDVCTTLFGSVAILTLTPMQFILCLLLSIGTLVFYFLFYRRIFTMTFDADFAQASGINIRRDNLLLAVVIAVIIVLAMNLAGTLLVSALVVLPAIPVMRVCRSFRGVTLMSAIISVFCALVGMFISIGASTPIGATVVVVNLTIFVLLAIVGWLC